MSTTREAVVEILCDETDPTLKDLGLPTNNVFQADTITELAEFPAIVVRWLRERPGIGPVSRRPFDLWIYDKPGDYRRAEKLGDRALKRLGAVSQYETDEGRIMAIETQGEGLGRGEDLFDDGYDAVVIPFSGRAIATGV